MRCLRRVLAIFTGEDMAIARRAALQAEHRFRAAR
jgi:hypothetical protein